MRRRALAASIGIALFAALAGPPIQARAESRCVPGQDAVELSGVAEAGDEGKYQLLGVEVAPGTTRLEIGYEWGDVNASEGQMPNGASVVDLGLWGPEGTRGPDAFRGWGGSRQGVLQRGMDPVFLQADRADRGFRPGPIRPGLWHVELGFGNVAPSGATWRVEVRCLAVPVGPAPTSSRVDASHVADSEPGWFHGDFHLHGWHSNPAGPTHAEVLAHAREVGLDIVPFTEYVVPWHQDELGAVAAANPDLLVWPGREVITYSGHAIVLGETPNEVDYRHGFEDITLGGIQRASLADGALFGVAHPTIFPDPLLGDFCRGCAFELSDAVDWSKVTTIEVLTGPVAYDNAYLGGPGGGPAIEFPFMVTAIDFWEDLLLAGHRITAVSGSDAKQAEGHGSSATAVYATELSRTAVADALRGQRAYVRTRGALDSPTLDFTASADGKTVMLGGTLVSEQATLSIGVAGAMGHRLSVTRNGLAVLTVPIPSDDFTIEVPAVRGPDEGPLGTFYRVDTWDPEGIRSLVSNPIWLSSRAPEPNAPAPAPSPSASPGGPGAGTSSGNELPATGGGLPGWSALLLLVSLLVGPRALRGTVHS